MTKLRMWKSAVSGLVLMTLLVLFLALATNSSASQEADYPSFNADGTVTLPLNAVAYGVRDPKTNAIINKGEVIRSIDGKLNVIYNFEQNMPEAREYVLLVFVNNVQREFSIDGGETLLSHTFRLAKKEMRAFIIEIELNDVEDKEISFVVFSEPGYTTADDSMTVAGFFPPLTCRYLLYGKTCPSPDDYSSEAKAVEFDATLNTLFTAADRKLLRVFSVAKSGQEFDVLLSNPKDCEVVLALGALLDWKQHAFADGELVKYFKMPPKSTKVLKLTAPSVTQNTPYQVFAAPYISVGDKLFVLPYYEKDIKQKTNLYNIATSLRTVIVPKDE